MSDELCFFDVETTGLQPEDRIIQLSLLRTVRLAETFGTIESHDCEISTYLLNPEGRKSHPKALQVHGISDGSLLTQPTFKEKAAEIIAFIGNRTIVAHNAQFDLDMLESELHRCKLKSNFSYVCSLELVRENFPGLPSYSLDALCKHLKIQRPKKHNSEDDVIALYQLFHSLKLSA